MTFDTPAMPHTVLTTLLICLPPSLSDMRLLYFLPPALYSLVL
jgi:hypothetical protein